MGRQVYMFDHERRDLAQRYRRVINVKVVFEVRMR